MNSTDDILRIKDMEFHGYHGCTEAERKQGNKFRVTVELFFDQRKASRADQLESTVDVNEVYSVVKNIVKGSPKNLIETVAEELAESILEKFEIVGIKVMVAKDKSALPGTTDGYEVEIFRS